MHWGHSQLEAHRRRMGKLTVLRSMKEAATSLEVELVMESLCERTHPPEGVKESFLVSTPLECHHVSQVEIRITSGNLALGKPGLALIKKNGKRNCVSLPSQG